MNERDLSLDLLRAIGLLSIILAHVNPPQLLFQLRTFDVIMMVAVSAISYTEYSQPKPYGRYLWSRVNRLLFPTEEFILLIGVIFYVLSMLTGVTTPFPLRTIIIGMFTLCGVGYLWVIRVFLYNALLDPFVKRIAECRKWGSYILVSYIIYIIVEHFCICDLSTFYYTLAESSILNFMSYGIIAIISYKLYKMSTRYLILTLSVIAVVLLILCIVQHGFVPNTYKYPPKLQYMLWGLLVVGLSFGVFRYVKVSRLPAIITFISANSLWVYFWHIVMLNLLEVYPQCFDVIVSDSWILNGV